MQEIILWAFAQSPMRPVIHDDIPLWFAVLLAVGLVCATVLTVSGLVEWWGGLRVRHHHR